MQRPASKRAPWHRRRPRSSLIKGFDDLIGGTDRARFERETGISSATASNDFRRLLDAGLVVKTGRGRRTRYLANDELRRQVDAGGAGDG